MSEKEHRIQNPVIPGFYRSVGLKRGDDFYLVNQFELDSGFYSRDLAHWEQISYAMV